MQGRTIRLRDFILEDQTALSALSGDEPIFEYTKSRLDHERAAEMVHRFIAEASVPDRRSFALVVEGPDSSFAGWAGLDGMEVAGQAEFGWYLASPYWGRGYATEATALLLEFGFTRLDRTRMIATADPDNTASIRVLEKSGLSSEGVVDPVETWRGLRPRLLFSLTRADWATTVGVDRHSEPPVG